MQKETRNKLNDFDDNFEDDELNSKKENTRNFKENEREECQQYSLKSDSSYDETIKKLESTNCGIFLKSDTDVIQQMVWDVKFTIPEVNNSQRIKASFILKYPVILFIRMHR